MNTLQAYRCIGGPADGTFLTSSEGRGEYTDTAGRTHIYRAQRFRRQAAQVVPHPSARVEHERVFLLHNTVTGDDATLVIMRKGYL